MNTGIRILKFVLGAILIPIILGILIGGVVVVYNLIIGNNFETAWGNLQMIIESIAPVMPIVTIVSLGLCSIPLVIKLFNKR